MLWNNPAVLNRTNQASSKESQDEYGVYVKCRLEEESGKKKKNYISDVQVL